MSELVALLDEDVHKHFADGFEVDASRADLEDEKGGACRGSPPPCTSSHVYEVGLLPWRQAKPYVRWNRGVTMGKRGVLLMNVGTPGRGIGAHLPAGVPPRSGRH